MRKFSGIGRDAYTPKLATIPSKSYSSFIPAPLVAALSTVFLTEPESAKWSQQAQARHLDSNPIFDYAATWVTHPQEIKSSELIEMFQLS
jgi:hypothetical protein